MPTAKTNKLLLSVIIPAKDEADSICETVLNICSMLKSRVIDYEIIIINDHSSDHSVSVLNRLSREDSNIRWVENDYPPGFGFALRKGLDIYRGDAAVIVMADGSDSPSDIVKYYDKICEGYDCVFGTRFASKSNVHNYPFLKLLLNRIGNLFIQVIFLLSYNDVTNAFKCYSRRAIDGIRPLLSCHFNLTVEMPLKSIVRGYSWCVIPTDWYGRKEGISKWKIKELGSRYLFIIIYIWVEKILTRGDYLKGRYWLNRDWGGGLS